MFQFVWIIRNILSELYLLVPCRLLSLVQELLVYCLKISDLDLDYDVVYVRIVMISIAVMVVLVILVMLVMM